MGSLKNTVLVIDDDEDITTLVHEILSDEGYAVTVLQHERVESIQEAVDRLEPNCILLDGGTGAGYGESWETAALMASRSPAIPVIMFTAHTWATAEAAENASARSQAAGFAGQLSKPFEIDELISLVNLAVRKSESAA